MEADRPTIIVVGSSNMDLVVKSERIPVVGETILGGDFVTVAGGKGANQAVAAAKLGARVLFVGKLGCDAFGDQSVSNFQRAGVETKYVTRTKEAPSGVALIMVDQQGRNSIAVAPGANQLLSTDDVEAARADIAGSAVVVAQLEVPLKTVEYAAQIAQRANVPFILDPAPARPLTDELLGMVTILTPNETEAQMLTGVAVTDDSSALEAAQRLLIRDVGTVIITLGGRGLLLADADGAEFVAARKVAAVDATAAGDAFTGGLAVALARGRPLREAAIFANHVAALSVMKMGAQSSMPTRREVEAFAKPV